MQIRTEILKETPKDLEEAHRIIQLQKETITQLQIEIAFQKEREAVFLELIRLFKQKQFAPSSEKNIKQINIFDEAGITLPEEKEEAPDRETKVSAYTRKKHPVRKALPEALPREVIVHDIPEKEKQCDCGTELTQIGEEITEQLKYIPAKTVVVQHKRLKYACKPCQENVKIAAMPILLLPKSIATPELVSHTIVSKFCDHLPLYRGPLCNSPEKVDTIDLIKCFPILGIYADPQKKVPTRIFVLFYRLMENCFSTKSGSLEAAFFTRSNNSS